MPNYDYRDPEGAPLPSAADALRSRMKVVLLGSVLVLVYLFLRDYTRQQRRHSRKQE